MCRRINILLYTLCMILTVIIGVVCYLYNIIPHRRYNAADFQIETIRSPYDKNSNGIDDYTDILQGAKLEIARDPRYRSHYYPGGYPPDDEGVCTDVIWRALKHAGYDLKQMIDEDIQRDPSKYPRVHSNPDPNIDFRRVPNVHAFLTRWTLSLTTDLDQIEAWQPGDIVVFSDSHIGILSDIRNYKGIPFLLHNGDLPVQEEDGLEREAFLKGISGHYRFLITRN